MASGGDGVVCPVCRFFPGWEECGTSAEPQHSPVSQPDGVSFGEIFFLLGWFELGFGFVFIVSSPLW